MSATETRINIEEPDSLGLSPDEEDKISRTDDTLDTNMAATSGANPPAPLAEVKLLSSAILSLTKRLDKFQETPSTKGKAKTKGKGKRSSQEPQSEVPAKKPAKGCSRCTSEQIPLTPQGFPNSHRKKLPKRVTRMILKARMGYKRRCRRSTRLKILLAKI